MTKFELSAADRRSTLWMQIEQHLNQRLDTLRRSNDGDRGEIPTALLRGQIAELKYILTLGQEPRRVED